MLSRKLIIAVCTLIVLNVIIMPALAYTVVKPGTPVIQRTAVYATPTYPICDPNSQLQADFTVTPDSPQNAQKTFKYLSTYPYITKILWDFGDGTIVSLPGNSEEVTHIPPPPTTHSYNKSGDYRVSLMLSDNCGRTSTKTKTITIQLSIALNRVTTPVRVVMTTYRIVSVPSTTTTISPALRITSPVIKSRPTVSPKVVTLVPDNVELVKQIDGVQVMCLEGLTECKGKCTNIQSDMANCGGCGQVCSGSQTKCSDGQCLSECPSGYVNLDTDPNNCAACGTVCPYKRCCNGRCLNWNEFDANCGECGNVCQDGRTCIWGPGWGECAYHCVAPDGTEQWLYHLNYDENCGGCNIQCPVGTHCESLHCMKNCPEGSLPCDENTCVSESNQNCARCGRVCGTNEVCENHRCICPDGFGIFEGTCIEKGTRSHCGNDFQPCAEGEVCLPDLFRDTGTCVKTCPYGHLSCGDGSCKDVYKDRQNCGTCGNVCNANQFCVDGVCRKTCPAASEDCQSDGTCNNLANDPYNCGACGIECGGIGGNYEVCINGICKSVVGNCTTYCTNYDVPGKWWGLSCYNRQTDPRFCGGKEHYCPPSCTEHQTCDAGKCVNPCPPGLEFCSHPGNVGCVDLSSDSNNCGKCRNKCTGGMVCFDYQCRLLIPRYSTCNGEDTDVWIDRDNCGSCGNQCRAWHGCDFGQCNPVCAESTYCDGISPPCRLTQKDNLNCGSCRHNCGEGETCVDGQCCPQGQFCFPHCFPMTIFNPNLQYCGDKCTDIMSDKFNCGHCGKVCVNQCVKGFCDRSTRDV